VSVAPFVVGQWVRGEKFYGRAALIDEILHGPRNWLWLLGTRRIGKTSLLKQIEHLTTGSAETEFFPVFWDFQGAEDPQELHMGFGDALLDAEERLEELEIATDDVQADDLFASLGRLRRKLRAKGRKLLLLCDEVEELIKLNQRDPSLLRKLRRALQSQEDVRSVLASTIRLWALADERGDTSPFLHGFSPPLYIHNLTDDDARALIRQAHLASESRPPFAEQTVETIRTRCDNHPYLIQLLCKRCLELGDLDEATEQVASDPMVAYFFSVDFEMLDETEHQVIRIIAEQDVSTSNSIRQALSVDSAPLGAGLHRLEHLGYIRKDADRRFVLANYFFRRWLGELPGDPSSPAPAPGESRTVDIRMREMTSTVTSCDVVPAEFAGRYQLLQRIGRGATGVVYKAYDTMLRSHLAIKVLKDEYASNEEALERLRREILLSRDLAHPNVVRIYHLGDEAGTKYITMQWVDGPTLAKVIEREGPLDPARAVTIAVKLVSAVAAAHARQVLHRDIKPHNVLVDERGEPHVTDFGLARLMGDPGMTQGHMFVGTPNYASPEQASLAGVDERSDIYALGVVLFEMVTGRRPFVADSTREVLQMHQTSPPPVPRELRPSVPLPLSRLILKCLKKRPVDRFQTAEELLRALEALSNRRVNS